MLQQDTQKLNMSNIYFYSYNKNMNNIIIFKTNIIITEDEILLPNNYIFKI